MSDTDPIASHLGRTVAAEYRYLHISLPNGWSMRVPMLATDDCGEDQLLIEVEHPTSPALVDRIMVAGINCLRGDIEVITWDRHGDARQAWHERSDT